MRASVAANGVTYQTVGRYTASKPFGVRLEVPRLVAEKADRATRAAGK